MVHEMNELARLAKIEIDRAETRLHDANILIEFCQHRLSIAHSIAATLPPGEVRDRLVTFLWNAVEVVSEHAGVSRA